MKPKKQKLECEKCRGKRPRAVLVLSGSKICISSLKYGDRIVKNNTNKNYVHFYCGFCGSDWIGPVKGFEQRLIKQQKYLDPEISEMVDRKIFGEEPVKKEGKKYVFK